MPKILDQYQAAYLLGISPELLEYFTRKTVKFGDMRKLQVEQRKGGILFFKEEELRDYNNWLLQPWPSEDKKRPHLPTAIRNEVKAEASGECAICAKHGNSCEAAHIAPVATSKCNHPHNLLWLCANHHTKFDNGSLGPKGVDNELVKAAKLMLQHARKYIWQNATELSVEIAALIKLAKYTTLQTKNATVQGNMELIERIGESILHLLSDLTAQNKNKRLAIVVSKISAALDKPEESKVTATIVQVLGKVASYEEEFLHEAGLKNCPLCVGKRWYLEQECPVCSGQGTVPEGSGFDLAPFKLLACRLCEGSGRLNSEDCLACGGEGQLEARIIERIDWSGFEPVTCRLCAGKGRADGNDCQACGGEGRLAARDDERIDWSGFNKVTCRLCEGNRRVDGDDCPACGGEGRLTARDDEQIDWSNFEKVTCGLCKGMRRWRDNECPVCGGAGELRRQHADNVDLSQYRDVACPLCIGTGEFDHNICPECQGEGKMEEWRAGCVDVSHYKLED
jgi:DnaJ-class molecular chaperone